MLAWDELQDKDGVEECIHASARQQGPKLSLGLSNFQAGFRTEDESLPSVFSHSLPSVGL